MRMRWALVLLLAGALPAAAQRLPLPDGAATVQRIAESSPASLAQSCQSAGGTWQFLDAVVDALRLEDRRWGYNGKRGNANDPSHDAIAYHYGAGPREGSTEVYIIDVIGGHCGPDPRAAWIDQTAATAQAGTIGRWVTRGRFSAEGGTTTPVEPIPPTTPGATVADVLARLEALSAQVERLSAQINTTHAALADDVAGVRAATDAGTAAVLEVRTWLDAGLAISMSAKYIGTFRGEATVKR
jgi:hypothetical protein